MIEALWRIISIVCVIILCWGLLIIFLKKIQYPFQRLAHKRDEETRRMLIQKQKQIKDNIRLIHYKLEDLSNQSMTISNEQKLEHVINKTNNILSELDK